MACTSVPSGFMTYMSLLPSTVCANATRWQSGANVGPLWLTLPVEMRAGSVPSLFMTKIWVTFASGGARFFVETSAQVDAGGGSAPVVGPVEVAVVGPVVARVVAPVVGPVVAPVGPVGPPVVPARRPRRPGGARGLRRHLGSLRGTTRTRPDARHHDGCPPPRRSPRAGPGPVTRPRRRAGRRRRRTEAAAAGAAGPHRPVAARPTTVPGSSPAVGAAPPFAPSAMPTGAMRASRTAITISPHYAVAVARRLRHRLGEDVVDRLGQLRTDGRRRRRLFAGRGRRASRRRRSPANGTTRRQAFVHHAAERALVAPPVDLCGPRSAPARRSRSFRRTARCAVIDRSACGDALRQAEVGQVRGSPRRSPMRPR